MDALLQDPVLYWLIWTIATVFGVIIGWSLRASYREKAILDNLEHSEQERNSIAHLYAQLRSQHDQKTAEIKRISLEMAALNKKIKEFDIENATRASEDRTRQLRFEKAQAEALNAAEKVNLLEESLRLYRTRDMQFETEIHRLQEELTGWKKIHRDFSNVLQQLQTLEQRAAGLEQERNAMRQQLEQSRLEITNLQNTVQHTADGDSDLDEPDMIESSKPKK
jgi:chromosome segregation ATPase